MAYCTPDDILEVLPAEQLTALTDDAGAGVLDESVVARAIADAEAEIDSYCAARYPVPFAPAPVMIRKVAVDIAVYNLFARRRGAPPERKERYDHAVRFLRAVADGQVTLGAGAPTASAADGIEASRDRAERLFTPDSMSGY